MSSIVATSSSLSPSSITAAVIRSHCAETTNWRTRVGAGATHVAALHHNERDAPSKSTRRAQRIGRVAPSHQRPAARQPAANGTDHSSSPATLRVPTCASIGCTLLALDATATALRTRDTRTSVPPLESSRSDSPSSTEASCRRRTADSRTELGTLTGARCARRHAHRAIGVAHAEPNVAVQRVLHRARRMQIGHTRAHSSSAPARATKPTLQTRARQQSHAAARRSPPAATRTASASIFSSSSSSSSSWHSCSQCKRNDSSQLASGAMH
jgi:hypothetical protein